MSSIFDKKIPDAVYKYRSLDGDSAKHWLRQIVVESELYFSTPNQFNDPFDCAPVYRPLTAREMKKQAGRLGRRVFPGFNRATRRKKISDLKRTPQEEYRRRLESLQSTMRETGIYSVSANPDSLLMWSHYGLSHRGVCLQFDMRQLINYFTPREILGLPVTYSDERPIVVVGQDNEPQELLRSLFLVKATCWAYENEWRFLHYRGSAGAHAFPASALKAVILGARISDDDAEFVARLIEERKTPIRLIRAMFDEGGFSLNIPN